MYTQFIKAATSRVEWSLVGLELQTDLWSYQLGGQRWPFDGCFRKDVGVKTTKYQMKGQVFKYFHCSHEIERRLLFGRKVMSNLDSIFKSRDITLPTKVRVAKAMVFPVVMYGCESWTVKKAEHQRIDAFKLWCWWRLLRVPWSARRSNSQS